MSCLNNNTINKEDDYLIILHKDECKNDNELEEAIQLNLNGDYYLYQRTDFLDDPINYRRLSSQFLLKKIDTLKTYIDSFDFKIPSNFYELKKVVNEIFSVIDNIFQKKNSLVKEIENLRANLTSNFVKNIKGFNVDEEKIHYSVGFVYQLLKKVSGINTESVCEKIPNFNENESKFKDDGEDNSSQIDYEVNSEQVRKCGVVNNTIIELVTSSENRGDQTTNLDEVCPASNDYYPQTSEIENEKAVSEVESGHSDSSNIEDIDSDISQKSEPIINKNRMHKLYRRAGTVINESVSSDNSDAILDKDKYLKLIESYKNLTKTAEVKENICANQT